jgi:hypothetical protein
VLRLGQPRSGAAVGRHAANNLHFTLSPGEKIVNISRLWFVRLSD